MSIRPPDPKKVTARQLHQYLDILVARYLAETGKYVGKSTVLDLMYWSHLKSDEELSNSKAEQSIAKRNRLP